MKAAEADAAAELHEWAAFAAQQCAEKAVKALVQALHGSVRGHSVSEILRQLPASVIVPDATMSAALALDKVYFTARCPNGFTSGSPGDYFSEDDSRVLIEDARAILEFCRSQIN